VPRTEPLSIIARAGTSWEDASPAERKALLEELEAEMRRAADELDFELAAQIRDQVLDLKASGQTRRRADAQGAAVPRDGPGGPGAGRGKRARR
jgi:hypothetical protein